MIGADPEPGRDWGAVAGAGCLIVILVLLTLLAVAAAGWALHFGWNLIR